MYSLKLNGFKTKEQAKAFIDWYEGQGEQDSAYWFEELKHVGKLDVDFMPVNVHKKYKWEDDTLNAWLKI